MDPLTVKPHEAAGWTGVIAALSALLARLFKVRRGAGESAEVRELRGQLEAQKERNREQQLQLSLQPLQTSLADVLRENGRQQEQLNTQAKDLNALGNKCRELETALQRHLEVCHDP